MEQDVEITQGEAEDADGDDGNDEQDFEMLDLLCDAAGVDDYNESKKRELKQMNSIMDQRQAKRDEKAQT